MSFPVEDFERDPTVWHSVKLSNPGMDSQRFTYSSSVDGVFIGVQQVPDSSVSHWWGKLEANPSRLIDPEGWGLATADQLPGTLQGMVIAAAEHLIASVPVSDFSVKRLDVAVDFRTEHPSELVRGLGPVHRPWARRNLVHFDPSRSGAETLMVGSGAGLARLYDKWQESKGKAPEGTLRFEVEARKNWCRQYGGIDQVGDVTAEALRLLAEDRWKWSAMGSELSGTEQVIEKVMRSGLSPTVQRGLIGHLLMESHGCAYPLAKSTAAKYRKIRKELGLVLDEHAEKLTMRLDWESGREVTTWH